MDTSALTSRDLLKILDVTRRLAEQRMVQPLIDQVATTVFDLVSAERCAIVLFGEKGGLDIRYARDRQGRPIENAASHISRSILAQVRESLVPLIVSDAQAAAEYQEAASVHALRLRSVMCVPLVAHGRALGAIYVENRSLRGQFQDEHLVPLVLFAMQVVAALQNARDHEELEAHVAERTRELQEANALLARRAAELHELSIRDSLTGLFNRRFFTETLQQQFEALRRHQRQLAIGCLDVDNFKQINDTLLHVVGDRVLRAVGAILVDHVRAADVPARVGGEEFAILMPETTLADAALVCERVREAIEGYHWDTFGAGLRVTVSVGVAEATTSPDAQQLLRVADARLYAAKRTGKNRVVSE